ncbi:MAG: hypothetical protein IPL99_20070 [Candidatus Competibacteraceae bacterium]|nr:hypothetical protein [Candidatus Competibacteraceae bacterium]
MGWAEPEFGTLELGDARRTRRLIRLVDDLSAQPTEASHWPVGAGRRPKRPTGCWTTTHWTGGGSGGPYRANSGADAGTSVRLVYPGRTELDFTSQPGIAGVGATELRGAARVVRASDPGGDAGRVALGVLDAWMWARGPKEVPQVKESTRWVEGYEIVADLAETVSDTRLVYGRSGRRFTRLDGCRRPAWHPGGLADPIPAQSQHPGGREAVGPAGAERIAGGGGVYLVGGAGSPGPPRAANPVPGVGDVAGP